jgi:hypothetical protein
LVECWQAACHRYERDAGRADPVGWLLGIGLVGAITI